MLLFEVKEEEIEDSNDIDEIYIPQQSAMSGQSNCNDSEHEAPLPQVATNANDGEKWYKEHLSACERINSANILRKEGAVLRHTLLLE